MATFKTPQELPSYTAALFIRLCQFAGFWESLPIKWDLEGNRLTHNYKTSERKLIWKHRLLCLTAFLHICQNIVFSAENKSSSIVKKIQDVISIAALVAFSIHLYAVLDKGTDIILFINGLFQFLEKHPRKISQDVTSRMIDGFSIIECLNLVFAFGIAICAVALPISFVYGLHSINLCRPSLLGYFLLEECARHGHPRTWKDLFTKVLVFLGNHFIWSFGFQATVVVIALLQALGTLMLHDCLKIFWFQFRNGRSILQGRKACQVYRDVQILGVLSNDIQQKIMVPSMLLYVTIVHAFSITALVRLSSGQLAPIMMFAMLAVESFLCIIVMFGGMSRIIMKSKEIQKAVNWRLYDCRRLESVSLVEGKWQAKFFSSCLPIKVKFGQDNFVDVLTPLNTMNYSHCLAVQLLLIQG